MSSWTGLIAGGILGYLFAGPIGAALGAALGKAAQEKMGEQTPASGRGDATRIFCASAAAMLAKMAKADGRITRAEIDSVERAFMRLGFSRDMRDFAVKVFRKAKDDAHSIDEYAADFASAVRSPEVRILFYELLWDLACSDGTVSPRENAILRRITSPLNIPADWYVIYAHERFGTNRFGGGASQGRAGSSNGSRERARAEPQDALADAYRQLGVSPSASDDEVKKAYRLMAKKYHPDALRAQGLPEAMVGKATERMSRINAAWAEIKSHRGL